MGLEERMSKLFNAPELKTTKKREVIISDLERFGVRKLFVDPDAIDVKQIAFDNRVDYFNQRLSFTEYPIEKAYIYQQLSELYLKASRLEESQQCARDILAQAQKCKSNLWKFIGYYMIIKCDAVKKNYTRIKRNLRELSRLASQLSKYADVFVQTAIRTCEDIEVHLSQLRTTSKRSRSTRSSARPSQMSNDSVG